MIKLQLTSENELPFSVTNNGKVYTFAHANKWQIERLESKGIKAIVCEFEVKTLTLTCDVDETQDAIGYILKVNQDGHLMYMTESRNFLVLQIQDGH